MTARMTHILDRLRPGRRRGGFTLIELLVVISIIVLLLALAVPLIGSLRGGRSVDAGQNIVSAMLQRARARAIWLQERRGVFFFDDQVTGKTAMLMVKFFDTPNAELLEIDDDNQEPEYLPQGIAAAFVLPPTAADTTTTDYHPYGLIVFDGLGRIDNLAAYKLAVTPTTYLVAQFGKNLDGGGKNVIGALGLNPDPKKPEPSEAAFVIYDRRGLADQGAPASDVEFAKPQKDWLDKNAVAIVMNRYNGTLIRGE